MLPLPPINSLIEFRVTPALLDELRAFILDRAQLPEAPTPATPKMIVREHSRRTLHSERKTAELLDILRRHSVPILDPSLLQACTLTP